MLTGVIVAFALWHIFHRPKLLQVLPEMRSPRILIEKSSRRLTLLDGQKVVKVYRASIGRGEGDKVHEGDGRTPEGDFYVCMKNPNSKYTLSLGLSYPNVEDARRGLREGVIEQGQHDAIVAAIAAGRTPLWDTPLGGEIMIHGCGSERDWTVGCVALDDGDIGELFPVIPVGTPVTIQP